MSVLLLQLAGPLQAWGSASRFARRGTEREPTKSGVLGLLAAAQGRRRTDPIEDLLHLEFGVRVDQPGSLMQDFHTAGRSDGISMLTRRFYLSDALFLAGVSSDDEGLIEALDSAVRAPAFPLYLGRRSCPPSGPVSRGIRSGDLEDALRQEAWLAAPWHRKALPSSTVQLRMLRDGLTGEAGRSQRDLPLSFDPVRREYGWRNVVECRPVEVQNEFGRDTYHDPISELGG